MTAHPTEELAAFALGVLDPGEAGAVRAHLDTCPSCRAEIRAFGETAWMMAETAARDAAPSVRAAIVERARRESRPARRPGPFGALAAILGRPLPFAVPLSLAVALVVAAAGYVVAQRDADRYGAALAGVAGARVVALAPTGEVDGVSGSLVVPQSGEAPYLILELPTAPPGKTWEAWVIRGQVAVAAGITDARGLTTLVLRAPLVAGDSVAITAEPRGGLDQPTGKPVLVGRT
jgi:anti-sigma factor RsiW